MSDPTTPVIELQGLELKFGTRQILKGLSASLTGRCIGLLGPNGAGKTTLLHTLLGFHPPSAGTARVFGHDIQTETRAIRGLMGYMPESDAFISGMTAVRFVRLMGEISGLPSERALERAHETLFYVGLGEARYRKVDTYSLGMRQAAKLAQALVHGPKLIFLDEPTNGLDPVPRERMLRLIRDIRDNREGGGVRMILSSHLLRDVEECCDEVLVLKEGKVAVTCDLEAERRSNRNFLDLELRTESGATSDPGFSAALEALGAEVAASSRQRIKVVLPEGVGVRDLYKLAAERKVQIRRLDYKRDSLEDIFLK